MLDVGFFELLVIAVIGLLVVGPEKLPKYIAQGIKTLRNVRDMATKAKDDIVESAGIKDLDLKNLSKLDPTNLANNVFDDKDETKPQVQKKFDQDAT
ncbi:MAG: twin-arginine translocase subunit TatB [Candidatus Nanopelagicales bacterium]|nr:twin-arginine translocase subunit TatB [Candidatus Nanopelagicales bacterium]MBJ7394336.1 twin-arginine translocase subunit TatB [Candidatus Nanopelagicales bacterium]